MSPTEVVSSCRLVRGRREIPAVWIVQLQVIAGFLHGIEDIKNSRSSPQGALDIDIESPVGPDVYRHIVVAVEQDNAPFILPHEMAGLPVERQPLATIRT